MSHEPEPWQTNEARPFVVIEKARGTVSISSLGKERFRVEAPGHDSEVEGYDQARALAHELAAELESRRSSTVDSQRRSARTVSKPVFVVLLKHGGSHEERDPCRSQRQGVVHFRREQSCTNRRTQGQGRNERRRPPEKAMIHSD